MKDTIEKLEEWKNEIIRDERKRIYDRWMEIYKNRQIVRDWAAELTLDELAQQEKFPPYDKNK